MRHVSRIRRVALDWLFDRINLDPKVQIKYVDTQNKLADMSANGNFTRDAGITSSPLVRHHEFFDVLSQPLNNHQHHVEEADAEKKTGEKERVFANWKPMTRLSVENCR